MLHKPKGRVLYLRIHPIYEVLTDAPIETTASIADQPYQRAFLQDTYVSLKSLILKLMAEYSGCIYDAHVIRERTKSSTIIFG